MIKLTPALRKQFNITGKPFSKIRDLPVGTRFQFVVKRDTIYFIKRTCKVIPLPEGFVPSSDKVYADFDDGLPHNGFFVIWDFNLIHPSYPYQTRYYEVKP